MDSEHLHLSILTQAKLIKLQRVNFFLPRLLLFNFSTALVLPRGSHELLISALQVQLTDRGDGQACSAAIEMAMKCNSSLDQ